jgi:hypothetical protein
MKKRFSEEQIIGILKEYEAGKKTQDISSGSYFFGIFGVIFGVRSCIVAFCIWLEPA